MLTVQHNCADLLDSYNIVTFLPMHFYGMFVSHHLKKFKGVLSKELPHIYCVINIGSMNFSQ